MTKANWKEAPHDAETYEQDLAMGCKHFCKPGFYWSDLNNRWYTKPKGMTWSVLEHRPRIIAWEDMKEGMVVRCLHSEGWYNYKTGKCYPVGLDEYGDLGPLDDDGHAPSSYYLGCYTFELVSEQEKDEAEREEEVWTHYLSLSGKCKILIDTPDCSGRIIVIDEDGEYLRVNPVEVKPIKPTITKAEFELLEKTRQYFDIEPKDFAKFMNDYEVK